jgi:hypothetical protein
MKYLILDLRWELVFRQEIQQVCKAYGSFTTWALTLLLK